VGREDLLLIFSLAFSFWSGFVRDRRRLGDEVVLEEEMSGTVELGM
jgi:hypothetical protein